MKKKSRKIKPHSRKNYQRMAHSRDRVRVKNWIKRGEFDSVIPTHKSSKSLLWLID